MARPSIGSERDEANHRRGDDARVISASSANSVLGVSCTAHRHCLGGNRKTECRLRRNNIT